MRMSYKQIAIDFIKNEEDLRLSAYPDPKLRWELPTIGFGTTRYPNGSPIGRKDKITEEQAKLFLELYIERTIEPKLNKYPFWVKMNDNQRAAIISFSYNLGANFFGKKTFSSISTLLSDENTWKDKEWVKHVFMKYCNPHDKAITEGLKKRRAREAELFVKE